METEILIQEHACMRQSLFSCYSIASLIPYVHPVSTHETCSLNKTSKGKVSPSTLPLCEWGRFSTPYSLFFSQIDTPIYLMLGILVGGEK